MTVDETNEYSTVGNTYTIPVNDSTLLQKSRNIVGEQIAQSRGSKRDVFIARLCQLLAVLLSLKVGLA